MCVTRPAVKVTLRLARAEAKLYLEDPNKLAFIGENPEKPSKFNVDPNISDLRIELFTDRSEVSTRLPKSSTSYIA